MPTDDKKNPQSASVASPNEKVGINPSASQRASYAATTNKRPDDSGRQHADLSRLTSGSAHSLTHAGEDHTLRCADVGNPGCQWETSGTTENEVLDCAKEHVRKNHGMSDWTKAMRNKVRSTIRHPKAA
jgi:predicted small metal-binding protein